MINLGAQRPLVHWIAERADSTPDAPAFETKSGVVTAADFWSLIVENARLIAETGHQPGDRVLISAPNSVAFAAAYFATHAENGIAVPVDTRATDADIGVIVSDCSPGVALVHECESSFGISTHQIRHAVSVDTRVSEYAIKSCATDSADILYTTGTTGRRKGVLLTHSNVSSIADTINGIIRTQSSDRELVPIPLSHSFGLGRLRCAAHAGHCLLLQDGVGNAALLMKRILDSRVSGLALVPAGFEVLLRMTRRKLAEASNHLRYIEIGSAPIRAETRAKLRELLPTTRIFHHYGLTEASRTCFREYHRDHNRGDTVGLPNGRTSVMIRDRNGQSCKLGETGEISVEGPGVMTSYWDSELTQAAFNDSGELKTGDRGYLDADGYLYLVGRSKDIVNIGGLKVAPEEVDVVLLDFDGIEDAACVAVPDDITGQAIGAFYVSSEELDPNALIAWLRPRLEEYKIPKVYRRVNKIPKTESGKVVRAKLASTFSAEKAV